MEINGKFKKVSFDEFRSDVEDTFPSLYSKDEIEQIYENIKLPKRSTEGSCGYDFYSPFTFALDDETSMIKIPTGIRVKIPCEWFLMIVPRSSIGFKYGVRLSNSVGIVDSDYYGGENEGHIFVKLCNPNKPMLINGGDRFVQGIFIPCGILSDDETSDKRIGGTGSTGK